MSYTFLSYFIDQNTPEYGGAHTLSIEPGNQISQGSSSNSHMLRLPNHVGTHIDFPYHFDENGKTINDYQAGFWVFNKVLVLECSVQANQIIGEECCQDVNIPSDTEFIILKTGFSKYRGEDVYWQNNPGVSPNLAVVLKRKCPSLKVLGFDFISLSSYQNRALGRQAHREFLVNNDILIVEDMNLSHVSSSHIESIVGLPLLVDRIDGVPISLLAKLS